MKSYDPKKNKRLLRNRYAFHYGSEGFGLVLIEAMSSGKPVIASNVQPIPDIVLDNVTGFLPFPERVTTSMEKVCIEPFIEKIQYLIENRAAKGKMGMEGRKTVEGKYSTDIVMRQIERLYEMLTHQYPSALLPK